MPHPPARLRAATRADIPAIWEVRYAVTENTLTRGVIADDEVLAALEERGRGWVVEEWCEAGWRLLGFGIALRDDGCIWALFVHPRAHGHGHGQRLMATMTAWLRDEGCGRLWLNTGPGTRAETFYRRLGWRCVGPTDKGELRFEYDGSPAGPT